MSIVLAMLVAIFILLKARPTSGGVVARGQESSKASRWWAAAVRQQRPATVPLLAGVSASPGAAAGRKFEGGITRHLLQGFEQQIKTLQAKVEVFVLVLAFACWSVCVNVVFVQLASLTIFSREASKTYFVYDLLADFFVCDLRIFNDFIY